MEMTKSQLLSAILLLLVFILIIIDFIFRNHHPIFVQYNRLVVALDLLILTIIGVNTSFKLLRNGNLVVADYICYFIAICINIFIIFDISRNAIIGLMR